jgi:hypothetical protein
MDGTPSLLREGRFARDERAGHLRPGDRWPVIAGPWTGGPGSKAAVLLMVFDLQPAAGLRRCSHAYRTTRQKYELSLRSA